MFKKRFLYTALILITANLAYGNMKEDVAFLNELYRQERYDMAISESKKFLANYPDSKYNKNIYDRLAKVNFIYKNYPESKKYFEILINNYKLKKDEKIEVYSYLYKLNLVLGNNEQALAYLEGFKNNQKVYEKTLYDSGVLLLNNGKNTEAIKEFKDTINLKGEYYTPAIIYLAMGLYNNGMYADSLKYLDFYNGLQENTGKDMPLLTYLYGASYYKLNNLEKAVQYFEDGLTKYPNDSYSKRGRIVLIEIYANRNEMEKALLLYSKIDSENDKKIAAKVLGDYFLAHEEYRRAIDFYDVIGQNKNDNVRYTYGYALYKLENYEKAINEFSKIKENKYISDSRYYTVVSYYNLGKYKEVVNFEKYLSEYEMDSKKHTDLSIIFANSYYEIGDFEKSYGYYDQLYKDYPTVDNLYRLIVLEAQTEKKEVGTYFEKYKTDFPDDKKYKKDIYLAVGNYYYKNGDSVKAENIYKEYMKNDKDLDIGNSLVNLLVNEKKYGEVIHYLDMLEENNDSNYLKGIAYMGSGDYEKANGYLSSLLKVEGLNSELKEKVEYNIIKNNFLWEKYDVVIESGEKYLGSTYIYGLDDIVDRIGLSYYRLGNYEKAREYFLKLEVVPEYKGYARFQIADSYYAEKNYEKARDEYKKVYSDKNNTMYEEDAKYWELNCILNLKNNEEYLKASDEFLKQFPNSSYTRNILSVRGNMLSSSGNTEQAVKEYENLYNKSEQTVEKDQTVEKIIELYDETDNIEAKSLWIEKFSDKYKKSYYKSISYREKNMIAEAQAEEKILLENDKYRDYALINSANDKFKAGKYDEALKEYQLVRDMDASTYKDLAVYQSGNIYVMKKENDKAEIELSKVFVLYPNSPYAIPAKLKLAEVYENKSDFNKAISVYKEVLENKNGSDYEEFIVEKLLFISLKMENKTEAEKYYKELQKINKETALKYDEFMKSDEEASK